MNPKHSHVFKTLSAIFLFFSLPLTAGDGEPIFEQLPPSHGLDFQHFNGMTGRFFLPEMMGPGGAFFDFDGDGDLDIYIIQGAAMPGIKDRKPFLFPFPSAEPPRDRLFRNDMKMGADGKPKLQFTDVTQTSGINGTGYGMGVSTADIDNDGDMDLFLTQLGPNRLFLNDGKGSFTEKTAEAGLIDNEWSTSSAFFDYDRDGFLDLYVVNYVKYDAATQPNCFSLSSTLDYCGPDAYTPEGDRLYRNLGNGSFKDVTYLLQEAAPWAGLGIVTLDFNGDGWLDCYVANDGDPNQLWINRQGKGFEDGGLMAGAALNGEGAAEAGMGVSAGDYDRDGDEDLFVTHLKDETNTLYANTGDGFFDDATNQTGLALPSMAFTAFGTNWLDVDNDGWLDLVVLNGAVRTLLDQVAAKEPFPLKQSNQLFLSENGRRFQDASSRGGPGFTNLEVSRGAVFGDVDNDGDTDVLMLNNNGPARLLVNGLGHGQNWLGFRCVDATGKRDLLGTAIKVTPTAGKPQWRRTRTDGSYLTAQDPRALFGLGAAEAVKSIEVRWPDGATETFEGFALNRYHTLKQGSKP